MFRYLRAILEWWISLKFIPLLCACLFIFAATGRTQFSSSPRTLNGTRSRQNSYSTKPFDLSLSSLGGNFLGNNLQMIWSELEKREATLNESRYQTKAEKNRLDLVLSGQLTADFLLSDLYAFVIPVECDIYDRINKSLPCYVPYSKSSQNKGLTTWVWKSSSVPKGSYLGENAFGALVKVQKATTIQYNIVSHVPPWLDAQSFSKDDTKEHRSLDLRTLRITISDRDSEERGERLKALLIGTLQAPYGSENVDEQQATFENPSDFEWRWRNVHLNLTQLWIFDSETGEILSRYHN